jgi:hypothetical protein
MADLRVLADLWITDINLTVIATRGELLFLTRSNFSGRDQGPEAFHVEVLDVAEINADGQSVANVSFDPDDLDAAFEELDARYLAGEAAPYAQTWSAITRACAAFNRGELPSMTSDSVNIDNRRLVTIESIDLATSIRAGWANTPGVQISIEAVHRLTEVGAVVTQALRGASQAGFDADWRMIGIFTVEGGLISRSEAFDENDLDAALARFDELERPAPTV